ncbi:MAG: lipocalin family protein [Chryseosolibacter sp.]
MKHLMYIGLFLFVLTGCGNDAMTNEEKLAGETEKTWEAERETTASGDKDKLTREEKKEKITFSRNGNVKMGDGNEMMSGQWSIEGNNLSLHFAGQNVTENFTIIELEKNNIKLRANDGSELTMSPD